MGTFLKPKLSLSYSFIQVVGRLIINATYGLNIKIPHYYVLATHI